jgi:hypothetical protein
VLSITVTIQKQQGFSKVNVKLDDPTLKDLAFEFPVTQVHQVEALLSQELGLSPKAVKKLVHYQISQAGYGYPILGRRVG